MYIFVFKDNLIMSLKLFKIAFITFVKIIFYTCVFTIGSLTTCKLTAMVKKKESKDLYNQFVILRMMSTGLLISSLYVLSSIYNNEYIFDYILTFMIITVVLSKLMYIFKNRKLKTA